MAERRPLTAGLLVVPPGADPDAVRSFVTQERRPREEPPLDIPASVAVVPGTNSSEYEEKGEPESRVIRKAPRSKKGPLPVGLIPVTVRLRPEIAGALKRASLERQLSREEIFTQQDIIEIVLEPWLRDNGYLA